MAPMSQRLRGLVLIHLWMDTAPLILKRASASRPLGGRSGDDYDVLADRVLLTASFLPSLRDGDLCHIARR